MAQFKYVFYTGGELPVQSVFVADGLRKLMDKLTDDVYQMRMEMKELSDENTKLTNACCKGDLTAACCVGTCGKQGC